MCFHWPMLRVLAAARERQGLVLLQYVPLSLPFLEMRGGEKDPLSVFVPYACNS